MALKTTIALFFSVCIFAIVSARFIGEKTVDGQVKKITKETAPKLDDVRFTDFKSNKLIDKKMKRIAQASYDCRPQVKPELAEAPVQASIKKTYSQ